jgi:hypothetical protein
MKWREVLKYAVALFVAQCAIGFLEGYFSPQSSPVLLAGAVASLVVCGAIFVHLGAYQPDRPFLYAWAALLLQVAAGSLLVEVLARSMSLIGRTSLFLILLELVVCICALVIGTFLGTKLRKIRQ